jgi:hypothetical protein
MANSAHASVDMNDDGLLRGTPVTPSRAAPQEDFFELQHCMKAALGVDMAAEEDVKALKRWRTRMATGCWTRRSS